MSTKLIDHIDRARLIVVYEDTETIHTWHGSRLVNVVTYEGEPIDCYGLDSLIPENMDTLTATTAGLLTAQTVEIYIRENLAAWASAE